MTQRAVVVEDSADRQWAHVVRHGTWVALAIGVAIAVPTSSVVPHGDRYDLIAPLVVLVALLHWLCVERRWGTPLHDALGAAYLTARTLIAFALTLLNPFFAFFAAVGYFDAEAFVPRRHVWLPLGATAVIVAGAQAGGLPPSSALQAAGFGGLVVVNATILLVVTRVSWVEADRASERARTIVDLELSNARLEQVVAENARLQAELVAQAREAGVHDERERLALEIHDTIAQGLTGIVTQLQAADDASDERVARAHRRRATDLARSALGEARRSVQGLAPLSLEGAGLERALRDIVEDFGRDHDTRAELLVTGDPTPLHHQVEAAVVRIAQEALTNVARHAGAGRVGVTVSFLEDELLLDVRDDGSGFHPAMTRPDVSSGFGIPGMSTRAARVAGELVVESEPGRGTALSLRVPAVPRGGQS